MRENRRFSQMRRECVNKPKLRELHAKCVILVRSVTVKCSATQGKTLALFGNQRQIRGQCVQMIGNDTLVAKPQVGYHASFSPIRHCYLHYHLPSLNSYCPHWPSIYLLSASIVAK